MRSGILYFCMAAAICALPLLSDPAEWVRASDRNARVLLEVEARFRPEAAGRLGLPGLDEQVIDLKPRVQERYRAAMKQAIGVLEGRVTQERDPRVQQDLQIMLDRARKDVRGSELNDKYMVPYFPAGQVAFAGLRALLDDQAASERRRKALVRLKRYAGMENGFLPIAKLAEDRIRERLNTPGLLQPAAAEVKRDLTDAQFLIDGIPQLFEKYKITGYVEANARLKAQLTAFYDFVKRDVLPRSRTDFRLPPELYAFQLQNYGIDIPPDELRTKAHDAFASIQAEMEKVAPEVAKARGYKQAGYRQVIRELKKEQFVGDQILPHYQKRLAEIEEIIRREHLLTLPERSALIRLASPAETAEQPAPHMDAPPLIGNTGQRGAFVLPLSIPSANGATQTYDDFTFAAASWTLTAHEARPGHELQFDKVVEAGISIARAVFAFNSTNVEGWGLYSEWITYPYMPPEGQLISLQHRLMRAARAFLDPELHMGKITPEQARRTLTEDVVLSDAMVTQETERYMFRMPGQATSYFYGYLRLLDLRRDIERKLGPQFNPQQFHDFILAQGLLPPALLRTTVEEHWGQGSTARTRGTSVASVSSACPDQSARHNHTGIELAGQERLPQALEQFRKAIELCPTDALAHYNLGATLERLGESGEAIAAYREGVRLRPSFAAGHLALGLNLAKKAELDEAAREFRTAVHLDPRSAGAHLNLGLVLLQQGQLEGAVSSFRQALRFKPDLAQAHERLGVALRRQGKPAEALEQFRAAVRFAPRDPEAHYNLGIALREQRQLDAALQAFQAAVQLKPDYEQARYNLALLQSNRGQSESARREMRQVAGLHQFRAELAQAKSLLTTASHKLEQHDADGALADSQAALQSWKDNPVSYYLIGMAWEQKGDVRQAIASLHKALELKPDYALAQNTLGRLFWQEGERGEAIAAFDRAIALAPDLAEAHYNRALAAAQTGDTQKALAGFRTALALKPDYLEAQLNLGLALLDSKQVGEAIREFRKAIERTPLSAEAHNNLGIALLQDRQWRPAAAEFQETLRLKPEWAQARHNLELAIQGASGGSAQAAEPRR